MPKITKVSKATGTSKISNDKTDWNRVYQKPQVSVDQEALEDSENPIIRTGKARRLNSRKQVVTDPTLI